MQSLKVASPHAQLSLHSFTIILIFHTFLLLFLWNVG